jgi:hypothetical protein
VTATSTPRKHRVTPSMIHSMLMIILLS